MLDNLTLAGCDDDSLYTVDDDGNSKLELTLLNEKVLHWKLCATQPCATAVSKRAYRNESVRKKLD